MPLSAKSSTSNAIRVENSHLSPIDRKARLALDRAINEATGDEADRPTGGFTIALAAGDNAGLIATVLPLARGEPQSGAFAGMVAIFVQDPIVMPSFPEPGLRRALWSHEERATCAPRHGARA